MKNRKKWILFLIIWILVVFLLNYFYSQYFTFHHKIAFFVSFLRVTSGLVIFYKLLLEEYIKEIFFDKKK